ncbi:hypothetical protein [Segeticoccus rhizosphaerae]|uniref:hypothetical protein n=1 Tax=Segeticoccus rhizosphaerae TaxID=1104777 RepID=UPI0010BFFD45|nr:MULTISPECIES: hypothetical protein [Intrasporangiaceae]
MGLAMFDVAPAERELNLPGAATTSLRKDGLRQTPVTYLDFTANGDRLFETLAAYFPQPPDYVGVIQDAWPVETVAAIERLLGQAPGDLPDGRVSLYVCPECGDLGCGAITTRLSLEPETVSWRTIGIQTGNEDEVHPLGGPNDFPEVTFKRDGHEQVLVHELARARQLCVGFEYPYERDRRLRRERRTRLLRRLLGRRQ